MSPGLTRPTKNITYRSMDRQNWRKKQRHCRQARLAWAGCLLQVPQAGRGLALIHEGGQVRRSRKAPKAPQLSIIMSPMRRNVSFCLVVGGRG